MITGTIDLDWKGKLAKRQIMTAVRKGMNHNLAECVRVTKGYTPVRTGILQGSMRMEPAKEVRKGVLAGFFGSWDVNYAIYVEKGTIYMSGYYMMERAASEIFQKLGEHIREALGRKVSLL